MKAAGVVSIATMVLGLVILVVLLAVGLVARQAVINGVTNRLKFSPTSTYLSPNYTACYQSTTGKFSDEYYMWNLTNLNAVMQGAKPVYNLTGPFVYVQWYCNYDHHVDYDTGYVKYRTVQQGYRFLRGQSVDDDTVTIINVNPAYLGVLSQTGGSETQLTYAMSGNALQTIIATLANESTTNQVAANAVPLLLAGIEAKIKADPKVTAFVVAGIAANIVTSLNVSTSTFFAGGNSTSPYTVDAFQYPNITLEAPLEDLLYKQLWTNGTKLLGLVSMSPAALSAELNKTVGITVTTANATLLLQYMAYLVTPQTYQPALVNASISELVYSQIGFPNASNLAPATVATLFSATSNCSLYYTNITNWNTTAYNTTYDDFFASCMFNFTSAQSAAIRSWYKTFATKVAGPLFLQNFHLQSWTDFAIMQWGSNLLNQSLGPAGRLNYFPEYAANTALLTQILQMSPQAAGATCDPLSSDLAYAYLTGPYSITNSTNLIQLLKTVQEIQKGNLFIPRPWGGSIFDTICMALYVTQIVAPKAVQPFLKTTFVDTVQGLFVARTVTEWLFTGQDKLLTTLGQNPSVSLVGNKTIDQAHADQQNYTYYRIYTGHNDLHWALMPYNEGTVLPFWNGTVAITGYNGTQFPPWGEINKAEPAGYPLVLFNKQINRTVPFVNKGTMQWEGVEVAYLTMTDNAIASAAQNPENYKYYAQYSGLINKTSNPPYLPIFLSRVEFVGAEAAVTANQTLVNNLYSYDPSDQHSLSRLALYLLVEPTLGSTVWGNLPIQANVKVQKTDLFYPNIADHFAPIYWNAIGDKAAPKDLDQIKNSLYLGQKVWPILVGVGVGVGVVLIIAGAVGFHHFKKHEFELKDEGVKMKSSTTSVSAYSE